MGRMKTRMSLGFLVLGVIGCSESAKPPLPPAGRIVVDAEGRWGVGTASVRHWLKDETEHRPSVAGSTSGLFRGTLPFPQFTWKSGDYEVTQLVYPSGEGFVARYHLMNHGGEARTCTLFVEGTALHGGKSEFKLSIPPGSSQFASVTSGRLAGKISEEALEEAARHWQKILGGRSIQVPDAALMTDYHLALAGMGGGPATVSEIEARLFKVDGETIRLLEGIPEPWRLEALELRALPTPFGPLTLKYSGAYDIRALELDGACQPPGGFLIPAGPKIKAKVDGTAVEVKDGVLRFAATARSVELFKPIE